MVLTEMPMPYRTPWVLGRFLSSKHMRSLHSRPCDLFMSKCSLHGQKGPKTNNRNKNMHPSMSLKDTGSTLARLYSALDRKLVSVTTDILNRHTSVTERLRLSVAEFCETQSREGDRRVTTCAAFTCRICVVFQLTVNTRRFKMPIRLGFLSNRLMQEQRKFTQLHGGEV